MAAAVGNQYAARDKVWRRAIERALAERSLVAKREALDTLAEQLLAKCDEGDMQALKELGDRLDGRVTQPIGGDSEAPILHKVIVDLVRKDA